MSSRLALDAKGRLVVIVTATCDTSLRVGEVFRVIGDDLPANERGFRMLGAPVLHGRPRLPDAAKRGAMESAD